MKFMQNVTPTSGFFYEGTEVFSADTKYQKLQIVDTEQFGRCLLLDGQMMLSTKEEKHYHELLVHPACATLDWHSNALVIGGGDLFTANLLAQYPFKSIDVIELDEVVVNTCKEYFREFLQRIGDPRININIQDATTFQTEKKYDFIALDLTDPDEDIDLSLELYSQKSIEKFKGMLTGSGIITAQVACPNTRRVEYSRALRVLQDAFENVSVYGKYIPMYGCQQFFAVASDLYDLDNAAGHNLQFNMRRLGVRGNLFSGHYLAKLIDFSPYTVVYN